MSCLVNPSGGISLLQWKREHGRLDGVSDEEWLLYAASQAATMGYKVDPQLIDRPAGVYNDLFEDVVVSVPS